MKTRINIKSALTLAVVALATLALNVSAVVVVSDSFDVPAGTAQDFNLQANQAARQVGSAVGVTYSDWSAAIVGATQTYLSQTEAYDTTGTLVMRNLIDAAGQNQIAASAVKIDNDLAPQLAGGIYSIYYAGLMIDRKANLAGNPGLESWYQGFSLGGSGTPSTPDGASTDVGFQMHRHGAGLVYADGVLQHAAIVPGFTVGGVYGVQIDVDETAGTASFSVDAGGVVTDMGTYSVNFEAGEATRNMLFNNRLFINASFPQGASWDAWTDAQVNNLSIQVIPEPATLSLLGMATLGLMAYRRLKI